MSKFIDITGEKYGRLTAVRFIDFDKHNRSRWLCKCDCGNEKIVGSNHLRRGTTKSCGCLQKEKKNTTHGLAGTRVYKIWCGMKYRCYNKNATGYNNYGGRGIVICDEWRNDYQAFHKWALSNGYKDNLTIDRINVNGNYEPSNCRWVTNKQQSDNRTTNVIVTFNGKTDCLKNICINNGMDYHAVYNRIFKNNWSVEEALTIPVDGYKNYKRQRLLTCNGETHNVTEWANLLKVDRRKMFNRLYKGYSVEYVLDKNNY